jgi:predicted phosphate transport protein (TIGR00153 family)
VRFRLFKLVPREEKFFDMFTELAGLSVAAARELTVMVNDLPNAAHSARKLKTLEHEGDDITHHIIDKLNRSFVTPIERGDIHALACALDEVIDYIEVVGHKISLYELDGVRREVVVAAELILASAKNVEHAVKSLRHFPDVKPYLLEINRLEEETDHLCRNALAGLLNSDTDAVTIIKWKEILEILEGTTDRCEDVANIVDGVIVKNA